MLKEFRDRAQGLPDLLNYAMMVNEGTLLLKDGAFCAGWFYQGQDLNSSSHRELEYLSARLNVTLCQLGDGWMIHNDFIRCESKGYPAAAQCAFPDPTSFLMDEERRQQYLKEGAHFESGCRLVLTYKPPTDVESRLLRFFILGDKKHQEGWEKCLHFFEDKIEQIENSLSNVIQLQRMDSSAFLTHLHTCITGKKTELRMPKIPVYLDTLLGSQDFTGGLLPKVGDLYIRVIGLTGLPLETEPCILNVLEQLPLAFRWSNRFITLDPKTAGSELKKYRKNWFKKRLSLTGLLSKSFNLQNNEEYQQGQQNTDALAMTADVDNAREEAESGLVYYGYYTSVIVLMGEKVDVLHEAAKLIIKTIELRGFEGRIETINALEAYLGSLPGHGYHNVRRPLIHTLNLADILPLTSVWPGLLENPCPYFPPHSPALLYAATSGATPFRFNLHVRDVGHAFIFGPTGNGKSTLVGLMCAQFLRYKDAQIFIFDKGLSAYPLCKALGGSHYAIASGKDSSSFYPLKHIDTLKGLNRACEWVELLLECQGKLVTDRHRKEIRRALIHLADQEKRTLTHYQSTLQDQEVKDAIAFYTLSGSMGEVLDAEQDSFADAYFNVFEMEELLRKGPASFLPTITHIFNEIDERCRNNRPTLIVVEEIHHLLQGRFGTELEAWFSEKRKNNVSVIGIDQTLSKILNSPYCNTILENCPTRIFLPNAEADSELNAPYYQKLGLTPRQIDMVKSAMPKRHYYYCSPLGNRLMDLTLGKVALSFVGVDGKSDRTRIDHLIHQYGEQWVYYWLKERELSNWAEYWLTLRPVYQQKNTEEEAHVII